MKVLPFERLRRFFSGKEEINTAILFGSFTKNRVRKTSDVDIGILLKTYEHFPWEYQTKLAVELEKIVNAEVDLLILNHVSPHIAYRAIKEGKILFQRNQSFWSQFIVKTISMNEDMEILHRKVKRG